MYEVRKSDDRGRGEHGWLSSRHTFSFANYHDANFMGFGPLRVINEDRVKGGGGFPTHPHRDMEILSYVLAGGLEHKDSMGTGSVIRPGDVQRMTAGTGVLHSEYNASKEDSVHFLQIWIEPDTRGLEPSYEQKAFTAEERKNRLRLIASPGGAEGSVMVHQDVRLFSTLLEAGAKIEHAISKGRKLWVQVANGKLKVGPHTVEAGDGVAILGESALHLEADDASEVLVFDLPA